MADVVTSQTLVDTAGTKTVMKFTNMSDGSGETLVTKMDASALTFMTEDATKSVAKIWWSINTTNGKSGVELLWAGSGTSSANVALLDKADNISFLRFLTSLSLAGLPSLRDVSKI